VLTACHRVSARLVTHVGKILQQTKTLNLHIIEKKILSIFGENSLFWKHHDLPEFSKSAQKKTKRLKICE